MDTSVKIAIIAAMEREIAPLVKGWRVEPESVSRIGRTFRNDEVIVVCAGMGTKAAHRAAGSACEHYHPDLLVSAGLAGALVPGISVGETIIPSTIINSATGEKHVTGHGGGVLVSASGVAGPEAKRLFARQYSAQLVDMEAAAVFEVSKHFGAAFTAVKSISDEIDFDVPDFEPFVNEEGRFLERKFILHIAFRPRMWSVVRKLATNSARASAELCLALRRLINESNQRQVSSLRRVSGKGSIFG